jgi:hypothetical protein
MSTTAVPREHELKFVLDNRRRHIVRRWLELRCPPDPHHPAYMVRNIYFDTHGWRSLGQKANSDFLKSKFRIRWYADTTTREPTSPASLEVKLKRGPLRDKLRLPLDVSGSELARGPLHAGLRADLATLLRRNGLDAPAPLVPAFQIDYTRHRFVHPSSASELCLDYNIHVPRVNRRMVSRLDPRSLAEAVLEVKGQRREMLPDLYFLTRIGCRKRSFSKYLACYRRVSATID